MDRPWGHKELDTTEQLTQTCLYSLEKKSFNLYYPVFFSINCSYFMRYMRLSNVVMHATCPLLFLPSIFPSIRVFSNESVFHIRWPNFWGFSFSISPSNDYSGLISFRMDWFDLLAIQGTLKSLLWHHSLKASILWLSAFFMIQASHPYMTTHIISPVYILQDTGV